MMRQGSSSSPRKGHVEKSLATEAASILVFGLGVFVFFAMVTYWPGDPSFFSNSTAVPRNACGRIGALLGSALLECFGIGAFLVPAALAFAASTIHRREGLTRMAGTLGGMGISVMSLTVFLTLQWKYWPYAGSLILTGGAFGVWLSTLLTAQFNAFGSSIVSLLVFCLAIALSTPISVARMGAWVLAHSARIAWKLTRLFGTTLAYLLGLFTMRAAHLLGDLLQKLIEAAVTRARARARAVKEAAALEAAGDKGVVIGLESELKDAEAEEAELVQATSGALKPEVPNALPELEKAAPGPAVQTKAPEILPPEPLSDGRAPIAQIPLPLEAKAKVADAAAKAAAKLERVAKQSRRGQWKLPSLEFLRKVPKVEAHHDREKLLANSRILVQKFADFGIDGEVTAVRPGPVITLYEFKPGPGVKVSRIAAMADDLSMALSAQSVRILAPLPGKAVVGIEIPSDVRQVVFMREFLQHDDFQSSKLSIPVVMGKDIAGNPYFADLAKMPHLLCAGQTGAGKSVFMNGLITSLLYRFTPDEMRMILVDPKFIEFRSYQDIPHLLLPVVDDPKNASTALKWAVREMERRYRILAMMGARNLAGFNQKVDEMGQDVVRDLLMSEENQPEGLEKMSGGDWLESFEPDENGAPKISKLPYIVVIIDELADLMMLAKKEVEVSIARIAQKARAAGIHLVIATQRPSTDVVTGLIKANLPSRVSFQLASYIDSRTILDRIGAERLLGQGDMLFVPPGISQLLRLHGAYLDDNEIEKITSFLRAQGKPSYRDEILVDEEEDSEGGEEGAEADDDLFQEGIELVKRSGHASASFLQRHLKIGYNRAARMIETMESRGIVGPADGAKPREVLMR